MMDGGGYAEQYTGYNGEQDRAEDQYQRERFDSVVGEHVDDSNHHRDSSLGKLFVGGIAWETTRERFTDYFCKYGEVTDAIIMMDKFSGRPRGFGFVTFTDPAVADKVLQEVHIIDGRSIEVKRTVPREDMPVRVVPKTRKLFVGGLIPSFTEDELGEYFSSFGHVVECQIMFDHDTGRSRGFGFVTFDSEETVERILSDGRVHELGGKPVEIKRALPKRFGGDYANDHSGGSVSKSYGGYRSSDNENQGGYRGKMSRGYDDYGNYTGGYMGNYGGGAAGFYGGYGGYGYGYGFWGPMYGTGVYGGNIYGSYGGGGGAGMYGGAGGFGGSKGYGGANRGYGTSGSASGRYHPYQK